MATLTHADQGSVTGGVDTHKHVHVAAVIDSVGRLLATAEFATTSRGYRDLLAWMRDHGELVAVGVEGCGSWGAGLSRHLTASGVRVVEVNRPNRQNRRRRGKSDVIDAEAAARAVLAGDAHPAFQPLPSGPWRSRWRTAGRGSRSKDRETPDEGFVPGV
jgi:transposase